MTARLRVSSAGASPSRLAGAIMLLVAALLAMMPGPAAAQSGAHIEASIHAESAVPRPGTTTRIAIRMAPEAGWHGYWSNPGDSGLPAVARWTLPEGVTISALRHPAPALLELAGLASYVHQGAYTLLAELTLPPGIAPGTAIPLRADISWLACSDTLCVPERATLALRLTAGDGSPDPASASLIDAALSALPQAGAGTIEVARDGANWRFVITGAGDIAAPSAHLFPAEEGWFTASAPQRIARADGGWQVTVAAADSAAPGPFRGILADGRHSYALATDGLPPAIAVADAEAPPSPAANSSAAAGTLAAAEPLPPEPPSSAAPSSAAAFEPGALWIALAGAVVGGLLLNLMPCVFPILSLKALGLARSGSDNRTARVEGVAYFAGSVITTTALGATLLAARALGHDVGWSFQLQDPRIILLLMLLSVGIALNLAGLFEVRGPSFSGRWLAQRGGAGAFGTGALAALIATPCSGPFMGVALGAALVLPAPAALAVFAGLGIGMALPFLLVAFVPQIQRWLPAPGAWMGTFRHILAVPMLLTAIGLAWVLGRQSGVDGLALGLLLAALAGLGLWWVGQRQSGGSRAAIGLAPVAAALLLALTIDLPRPATAAPPAPAGTEPFSEARLAELQAQGTPVFVDFTADWCLVCQVNERVAIDRAETQAAFAEAGVVTLVGDWTNGDPAITRFLERRGRNSIPYYLFVPAGGPAEELPQVLSSGILIEQASGPEGDTA